MSVVWQVQWYTKYGEECCEEFDNQSDAQNFMKYNEWEGNEHPKMIIKETAD